MRLRECGNLDVRGGGRADLNVPGRGNGGRMKKIVIADDEPSLRLLVTTTLASDQYDIFEARDGDEALALITAHSPDLVLLDIQMPGRTGLDVTRAVKSDPLLRHIRVILLTSRTLESDIRAGREAGADLYLTKPFSPLELLVEVERALGIA